MILTAASLLLKEWDHGLVDQELTLKKIFPRRLTEKETNDAMGLIVPKHGPHNKLAEGTFQGTQKALTEIFLRSEDRFASSRELG